MTRCRLIILAVVLAVSSIVEAAPPKRLPRDLYKSGTAIRNVFRPVVSGSSKATVTILVNGHEKALGAIVGSDGWVLTKASQIEAAASITCRLKDGTKHAAHHVGLHPGYDLAMLKLKATGLPVIEWKSDRDPLVGDWLATSGTGDLPLAVGVVSIRRRQIPPLPGFLGIAFDDDARGARITRVMPNSGASRAGLLQNDVITTVAGVKVSVGRELRDHIRKFRPGEILPLRVVRKQVEFDTFARLGNPTQHLQDRGIFMNKLGGQLSFRRGGFPDAFAHDTVLKPEQCGGPLVNLEGYAVGINIAREGRTESHAIPAKVIVGLLEELKAGRRFAAPVTRLGPVDPPPVPSAR
ncbi:MAG: trypsin-like peptidase domain-containing protein [Planctomycetaceae bacterium]